MTKVVVAMSMSLDGIAGPESADADGMAIFTAILGWQFPLRSWQREQGMEGGEDSVDSRVWAENFERFGPQVIGRTMFDFGYPNRGVRLFDTDEVDLRCVETIQGEGAVHLRYEVRR